MRHNPPVIGQGPPLCELTPLGSNSRSFSFLRIFGISRLCTYKLSPGARSGNFVFLLGSFGDRSTLFLHSDPRKIVCSRNLT